MENNLSMINSINLLNNGVNIINPNLIASNSQINPSAIKYTNNFISDEESSDYDDIESKEIENILRNDYNLYETREESRKREEVLGKLNDLIKKFIYKSALKTLPEDLARNTGGKIFTFGSIG